MPGATMHVPDSDRISELASVLADELAEAFSVDRTPERLETLLLSALREVAFLERERCASVAEERARMWKSTKLNDPGWPGEGRREAQARHNEAVAIADAIRVGPPASAAG
jgi:hypothetical protein